MTPEECSRAFSTSPMKRAKLRGLKRNAAVVLGNVGTEDVEVLTRALGNQQPLVREHAARATEVRQGEAVQPVNSSSASGGSGAQVTTAGGWPRVIATGWRPQRA